MVYGTAKRHHAKLDIESEIGLGTTVALTFTALSEAAPVAQPVLVQNGMRRLRILVVDDDPMITKSLCLTLENDGHNVTAAVGGKEGIEVLQAAADRGQAFPVVVTDLGMPYVDGRKVAAAAKLADPATAVILLTGWGQRLNAEESAPENVDLVLNKPPRIQQLRAALADVAPDVISRMAETP
jgi:CheY-like chemotaxis protein